MLFKARQKPTLRQRMRLWLWPRVSWRRSALYFLKRTMRLSGTPHAIAIGTGVGAFASFTPLLGFHIVMTIVLAWLLRGNLIAGAIGTMVGNPATYPLIWAGSYQIGALMLGERADQAPAFLKEDMAWQHFWPVIEPMLLGSIPLGLSAAAIVYFVVYRGVAAYQAGRRRRFADRRRSQEERQAIAESGRVS
jgi:uncharacterized protein (DUF2062 family)